MNAEVHSAQNEAKKRNDIGGEGFDQRVLDGYVTEDNVVRVTQRMSQYLTVHLLN